MAKHSKEADDREATSEVTYPFILKKAGEVTSKTPLTKTKPGEFTVSTVCAALAALDATPPQKAEVVNVINKADPSRFTKGLLKSMVQEASPAGTSTANVMRPGEALKFMNNTFAVTYAGADVVILREYFDEELGRQTVDFIPARKLELFYANWSVNLGGNNFVPLFSWWLAQPKRRTYKQVVFAPGREVEGCFNMWRGWAVEPDQKGSCDLFLEHVQEVICSSDKDLCTWVLDWLADAIQSPDTKPGTSIALKGEEGIGKGVFAQYVGKLYGEHFVHLIHSDHLVSRFNAHMKGCALLFADECFFAGDRKHEGVIKGLITEERIMVEMKFINAFPVNNRVRLIMSSNSAWIVPAGMGARRFCVIDVLDTYKMDGDYFTPLVAEMEGSGPAALMHFLLNRKITSDLRVVPKTVALLDQKRLTMSAVQSFWYGVLRDGKLVDYKEDWAGGEAWVAVESLYVEFIYVCKETGVKRRPTKDEFGEELIGLCPERKRRMRTLMVRNQYNGQMGKQTVYAYGFPPLDECRAAFEERLGQVVEWEEE